MKKNSKQRTSDMNHSKDYLELILSFPAEEKLKDSDKV